MVDPKEGIETNDGWTILRQRLELEYGFNGRNSALVVKSCTLYYYNNNYREVRIKNLSNPDGQTASGRSILSLVTLVASRGSLLEMSIEGTDDNAKAFAENMQRGLVDEAHLSDYVNRK